MTNQKPLIIIRTRFGLEGDRCNRSDLERFSPHIGFGEIASLHINEFRVIGCNCSRNFRGFESSKNGSLQTPIYYFSSSKERSYVEKKIIGLKHYRCMRVRSRMQHSREGFRFTGQARIYSKTSSMGRISSH